MISFNYQKKTCYTLG